MNCEEIINFCDRLKLYAEQLENADKSEMNDLAWIKDDFIAEFNKLFEVGE